VRVVTIKPTSRPLQMLWEKEKKTNKEEGDLTIEIRVEHNYHARLKVVTWKVVFRKSDMRSFINVG